MTDSEHATTSATEDRLITTWTHAAEEVFERLATVKPQLDWESHQGADPSAEDAESLEWWEAQFEAAGQYSVWIGIPAPAAFELARLGDAVAAANKPDSEAETAAARETIESLCSAFGNLLSQEFGRAVQYGGVQRLEAPPRPEAVYSTEVTLSEGRTLPILVGFNAEMRAGFGQLIEQRPSGSDPPPAGLAEASPLGLLLDLELPLSIRFGRAQLPVERVLELQVGSLLELEGSQDDPVDLLVNGRIVARGEVVAVDGNYGVRILEVLGQDDQPGTSRTK